MDGKLVTVFGGGGFVGRYVVQSLLKRGARVRVAERDPRDAWFLKPLGALGQTQFVAADVTRPATVANAVAGADAVVNLVGTFTGDVARVQVDGARAVASAARDAGAETLVHVSAIGADAGSTAVYGRTKGEGERAVRQAFASATIVRPSTIFGREDQFINRFAGMIARSPVIPVLRAPVRFQPVFVGDVADAIAAIVHDPATTAAKTFELAGPDILSMIALQRWIARTIARDPSFVELPDAVGALIARAGFLPGAPITRDQWIMLQRDTIAAPDAPGFADLGIDPTPLGAVAPSWLVRFRREGRFNKRVDHLAA